MTGPVVVALDYPGRRADAAMTELFGQEPVFDVRYVLDPPPREVTAAAYAAALVARLEPGRPVGAVLAYCLAAGIGQEVAALVTPVSEVPPPLVLFDAGTCDFDVVAREYHEVWAQFAPPDAGEAVDPAVLSPDALRDRPADVVRSMYRELIRLAHAELVADGIDADEADVTAEALADRYLDWLVHLVAGHSATFPKWGGDVVHIASAEAEVSDEPWPGASSTRVFRLDCAHADLLREPAARELVLEHVRPLVREDRSGARRTH